MSRNLDVAALRSFLTVARIGGVTRAATQLNLTQSAVSLQIKRLEAVFGQALFERSGRGVTLTSRGEQLVGPARQLLEINDETLLRMTSVASAGEIIVGVPDDLLHPHVPKVMRAFAEAHPRTKVQLHSGQSATLKEQFVRGALDLMLTTEPKLEPGAEGIARAPLVWVGAPGGRAWRRRPLPLGTVAGCRLARPAIESLNAAGFDWRLEASAVATPAMETSIAADMVVSTLIRGTVPDRLEVIPHRGALPALPELHVAMYLTQGPRRRLAEPLAAQFRVAYSAPGAHPVPDLRPKG